MSILSKTVFIFDIDSTIANNDHRAVLLTKHCKQCGALVESTAHRAPCKACGCDKHHIPQECWDAFLSPDLVLKDEPIPDAQRLIRQLRELSMQFHFITGRSEKLRLATEQWLSAHFGYPGEYQFSDGLYMRPTDMDGVTASQMKERLLTQLMRDYRLTPALDRFIFFEDDTHVFNMYSKYGIVIRCPEGLAHFCPEGATTPEEAWKR